MNDIITLAHGSGGKQTYNLVNDIFFKHFSNDILKKGDDSAQLLLKSQRIAFTTDSFVVSPIFFRGGNIGKLSVCGTVNDLVSGGAKPVYMSCGFIIEEGMQISDLEQIVVSMAVTARECGVQIVTGDTKVVQKGAADKIFINTSGIGIVYDGVNVSGSNAKPGDRVILSGSIGEHGCSIMLEREKLSINANIKSDCAPLNHMIDGIYEITKDIHVVRDATRGGIATTLNEIANQSNVGITLHENRIPVKSEVRGVCELLGLDPLYIANEGKMLIIAPEIHADAIVYALKNDVLGLDSCIIGEITGENGSKVILKTITGSSRILGMLSSEQLPRIC